MCFIELETLLSMTEGELEENEDPNHMMTPDEIAALLGAQEDGESAEAAETEPEVNDDPNHMMTPDEIAALLGAQDSTGIEEDEDIEEQMRQAELLGSAEAEGDAENDDLDIAQLIDGMVGEDADLDDIAELLKKSDQNELLDESIAE